MNIIKGSKRLLSHIRQIMKGAPVYPNNHPTAYIADDARVSSPCEIYMEEGTSIPRGATIMNGPTGKFIMKKWSFSSIDLMAICGNHMPVIGYPSIKVTNEMKKQLDKEGKYSKDIIIEEDVWIGARVTLLQGAHIGRGSIIAAGAVVTGSVPAYSIFGGVPAHFIKWKWSIDEILLHENQIYVESERMSRTQLESTRIQYTREFAK